MAVPTDPDDLASASSCYCYDRDTAQQVMIYLLANIAGLQAQTPSALATAAACYCYSQNTMAKVIAYLLCQAANSATPGGDCSNVEGAGDPT